MLATAVVLIAGAVYAVGRIQGSADDYATHAISVGQGMLIAMLDQETGLRGYINTHSPEFLQPYTQGRDDFDLQLAAARHYATDTSDKRGITAQTAIARRWQRLAQVQLTGIDAGKRPTGADARRRKRIMDQFRAANASFVADKLRDRRHDQSVAQAIAVIIIVVLGLIFGVLGYFTVERPAKRENDRQVARSEREAFGVLRRHLEGWLEQARAVVLIRNASANRLQAATGVEHTPVLADRLEGAAPEACLAVRLAKPYLRGPVEHGLLHCELAESCRTARRARRRSSAARESAQSSSRRRRRWTSTIRRTWS